MALMTFPELSPTRVPVKDWIEKNVVVPGARAGRVNLDPYQIEPLESVFDPQVTQVTLMWSSQLGKSILATFAVAYHAKNGSGDIYTMFSCQDHRTDYVMSRLNPIVRASPELQKVMGLSRSGNVPHHGFSFGKGNYCKMTTARSIGAGHSSTTRLIVGDEMDDWAGSVSASALRQRGVTFKDRTAFFMSTPTYTGSSAIATEYTNGSQAQYYVSCVHCGYCHVLTSEGLREGPDELGVYACPGCGTIWSDLDRIAAIRGGEWVHSYPERAHKSYQMSQLYSIQVPIERTWEDWEACETDYHRMTQIMAWPYEEAVIAPLQPEDLVRSTMPFNRRWLTIGVDVQKTWLDWTAVAFDEFLTNKHAVARGIVSRSIDYACFQELRRTWAQFAPDRIVVDGSYDYDWVRQSIDLVFADAMLMEDPPIEIVRGYTGDSFDRPLRGAKRHGHFVGASDEAKKLVVQDLKIGVFTLDHAMPDVTEAQLMSEKLVRTKVGTVIKRKWEPQGGRNEILDCCGYAYMGALALPIGQRPSPVLTLTGASNG